MKYLGKGDSPESIVTKQRLEETISERIAAIPKAGVDTPGLLSSEDYSKLAGIEPSANFYTHPTAHPISFITGLQATLDAKAPVAHNHTIANIENLQNTLNAKAPTSHTHEIANITNLQTTLNGKANASHTHSVGNVTGLQAALDDKADVSYVGTLMAELEDKADAFYAHLMSGVEGLEAALDDKANASHTHLMSGVEGLEAALSSKASASHVYAIAAELNEKANAAHSHDISSVTGLQAALDGKVDDSQVLTNVPLNAKFTDTITTINSKTGAITKADIVALGIPAQDTVVDISGKADKTYVDSKVKTDVPVGAKFTDTVYSHPASHPASMITGLPTSLPANGGNADTVGGFTVGVNVPANAKFTDTNTTYSEITTAEIDAGTASTGRTITGRRVKYILDKISGMISAAIGALTKSSVGLGNVDNTSDASKPISTATQAALDGKVNNSQVLTNVPSGAKFTDTLTTINGKTGAISKADIVALGIPAQDTVVDISGKADKTYVDSKVKTDVPVGAKFTDTVYTHPTTPGNKHIPTGGASGQVLKYSASGTATWQADNDTITTINGKTGAISKADITALGIPAQDTVYTHPTTHSISEISGLQTALDAKAETTTLGDISGINKSGTTTTYLRGDGTWATPPNTNTTYAAMSVAEGTAGTATASRSVRADYLKQIIQSYIPSSLPASGGNASTVGGFTVGTNVPANAKFTDTNTTYSAATTSVAGLMSAADKVKLNGIATGANKYVHPSTHSISEVSGLDDELYSIKSIIASNEISAANAIATKQAKVKVVTTAPTNASLYDEGDVILVV